jgi:xanthosine utilization system XapX-like protein
MKKYLLWFGAGILIVLAGVFSKIQHYPGADVILISGLVLELVSFILLAKTVFIRQTRKK